MLGLQSASVGSDVLRGTVELQLLRLRANCVGGCESGMRTPRREAEAIAHLALLMRRALPVASRRIVTDCLTRCCQLEDRMLGGCGVDEAGKNISERRNERPSMQAVSRVPVLMEELQLHSHSVV